MVEQSDRYARSKARTSYASTVVSISLVLFMLGILGLVVLNAQKLSVYVKENLRFQVFLKENVREPDIIQVQKSIDAAPYVKSTEYVTKQQAAEILEQDIGEDFIEFLGFNPLLASIDIKLKAEYAHPDSIEWIAKELTENGKIHEVVYSPNLIEQVNKNINTISLVILGFSALLLIISVALINNTIRLAIFSKRFIIRSMQLVGATSSFIRRPFLIQGLIQGLVGGLIAIFLIIAMLYLIETEIPDFFELQDLRTFCILFGIVILMAVVISWISTSLAVRKYLRTHSDNLY